MSDPLIWILAVALVVSFVVIARLLIYVGQHPRTEAEVLRARQQSVAQSHATVTGKVQEQIASLYPEFEYNPRDARFIGSPIDFVVFDGLDEGEVRSVVFVEVKTNRASLQHRERLVRDAVEAKRVEWRVLRLPGAMTSENSPPSAINSVA